MSNEVPQNEIPSEQGMDLFRLHYRSRKHDKPFFRASAPFINNVHNALFDPNPTPGMWWTGPLGTVFNAGAEDPRHPNRPVKVHCIVGDQPMTIFGYECNYYHCIGRYIWFWSTVNGVWKIHGIVVKDVVYEFCDEDKATFHIGNINDC
jgi:hypothetical protein